MTEFQEFGGPEERERLEAEQPEAYLRRREFLTRTAALAGLAGVASILPTQTLVSQAARRQLSGPFPSPRNMPLDTVVVLMMENRSFDHYFGWFPNADGKLNITYADNNNVPHSTHHLGSDYQGCGFHDPNHEWDGSRVEYNDGKLDGFAKVNDDFALGYYLEKDIPFIPHAARAFTLYDRWFASILGPTFINRHFQWSAQAGARKTNALPVGSLGEHWENIFDRAQARGLSVRYYTSDQPFALTYGTRALPWIRPVAEFYVDAAAGQLPQICFVDPAFLDGGGGRGLSGDEHPHGDIRIGQAFMSDIVHAFMSSPQWRRGALFINYDEWGGFFDHVSPIMVPDDRFSRNLEENRGITGFRIPGVVVSPFAKRGHVSHQTVTHESILKLISYRWGLGYLNKRHRYASNIGRSLDFSNPNFDRPDLPDPSAPVPFGLTLPAALPCDLQSSSSPSASSRSASSANEVEMGSEAFNEYAARLGYDVVPWTPDRIFSSPDSVVKALQGAG